MAFLDIQKLCKDFGGLRALADVEVQVTAGEIVSIIGPNGAGKSTTLKILTCYLPPTSGGATIAGFNIFHQSEEVRQKLGQYAPSRGASHARQKVKSGSMVRVV